MDKRIIKTKNALYSAFFKMRKTAKISEIKIMDLCKEANVNKTTFYAHYSDIYDLARDTEKHMVKHIIMSIPREKDYNMSNPELFTKEVTLAFIKHSDEIAVMFDDGEISYLCVYMEQEIKKLIYERFPEVKGNTELDITLTYCIYGAFHAYLCHLDTPVETVVNTVERITKAIAPLMGGKTE